MIAEANAVVSLPNRSDAVDAAPLLCAGVTTYNALRNAPLRSGDPWLCREWVASVILVSNTHAAWVCTRWHRAAATKRSWPENWVPPYIDAQTE